MDTGEGRFRMLSESEVSSMMLQEPGRQDVFKVGEELRIKDSHFRITKITRKKMMLRILPRAKRSDKDRDHI